MNTNHFKKASLAAALAATVTTFTATASTELLTACKTNPTPATYDTATKKVNLPGIDIPVLNVFTGMPTGDIANCNGVLQMQPGIEDFKIETMACNGISDKYNFNNAQYLYFTPDTPFANGGQLILCTDVPRVITIPPATQIAVAPERYLVTMRQLAVAPDTFHIEKLDKMGTLPPPNDCTNVNVRATVQSQLFELFGIYMAARTLVVVDYDTSGVWPYPITKSVSPQSGTFTKTLETGQTGTYIDGILKSTAESSAIHNQIAGKRLRFNYNPTTRVFSCKNQTGVPNPVPGACLERLDPAVPGLCDI